MIIKQGALDKEMERNQPPRSPPPREHEPPLAAPGLMAVIRNPSARTLAVLYDKDITYSLVPSFLIDQMLRIPPR